MPPSVDLPPPPEHPELPPEARIEGEEDLFLRTADGITIEARAFLPAAAERVVVLCHPHPLYGATMHNALILVVARGLRSSVPGRTDQVGWLRLNYRGVGQSGGAYGAGNAEVQDARAAIVEVRRRLPAAKISIVGVSFGTGVGYRAAVAEKGIDRIALVAPLPRVMRHDLGEYRGPVEVVAASEDIFCTPDESRDLAQRVGASFHLIAGADHQFIRFRREVAGLVVPFIAPELAP